MPMLSKYGRPLGRPKGSINKVSRRVKELAGSYMPDAVEELARIAGLKREPILDDDGNPVMEQVFDNDGNIVLNTMGEPLFRAKMRKIPGSPLESNRISAINSLFDRALGRVKSAEEIEKAEGTDQLPIGRVSVVFEPPSMIDIHSNQDDKVLTSDEDPMDNPAYANQVNVTAKAA